MYNQDIINQIKSLIDELSDILSDSQWNTPTQEKYYDIKFNSSCDFYMINNEEIRVYSASPYMTKLNRNLCEMMKLSGITIYRNENRIIGGADVLNKVIIYCKYEMQKAQRVNKWSPVAVIAHEIGHHYNKHIGKYSDYDYEKNWNKELQADFVAGFIMSKLNVSKDDTLSLWREIIYQAFDCKSHPNGERRIKATYKGWQEGKK